MADFQAAGVTAYLPKPLNFDELVRMVRQYVG
jgi:DNA-binding NarL/FixJ family response regulator